MLFKQTFLSRFPFLCKGKLRCFDTDTGTGRYRFCDKGIAADDSSLADHGLTAQDRCAGVDRNIVFNRRMTLYVSQQLTASCRQGAERNTLIDLDMIADDRCLADHDTGTVVDEEIFTDDSSRVDVDSGVAVCILGHDTWDERYV